MTGNTAWPLFTIAHDSRMAILLLMPALLRSSLATRHTSARIALIGRFSTSGAGFASGRVISIVSVGCVVVSMTVSVAGSLWYGSGLFPSYARSRLRLNASFSFR
ncbi:MAG: hypothetical protein LBK00_04490 [Treponema sp.]|nr:hypothetical protein [Treponema sp.]